MNMYTQIYDIIVDAIFGAAEMTSGQLFAVEQLSLWLSLFVLLLPFFVGLAILVRCIRR